MIAESLAMIAKCLVTVVMVVSAPQWGLYIFSAAQVYIFACLHTAHMQSLVAFWFLILIMCVVMSQCVYAGFLLLCYVLYFVRFLGSEEAEKKSFPVSHVKDLLPSRVDHEVTYFIIRHHNTLLCTFYISVKLCLFFSHY